MPRTNSSEMALQTTEQARLHETLLVAVEKYLQNLTGELSLPESVSKTSQPYTPLAPSNLPVQARIKECPGLASERSLPVVQAILNASTCLQWQQSYTSEDGFDANYLHNYGWFNLISPDGPFVSSTLRISFGFWGEGLHYKEHWHEPEETYVVLAGCAVFHSEGRPSRNCRADDVIQHHSNQRHAIDMRPGPLLVMAIWRGRNLTRKPKL